MGCNMCMVQKPDESYQVTIQVDSKEISRLSQSKTPKVYCNRAQRQGLRRKGGAVKGGDTSLLADCVDSGTQTEISFQNNLHCTRSPPLPPVPETYKLSQLSLLDDVYHNQSDYLDLSQHDVDTREYEEVELCNSVQQVKLGLPVYYCTDVEEDASIYTGENAPDVLELRQEVLCNVPQLPRTHYSTRVGKPGIQRAVLQNQTQRIRSLSNSQDVDSGVGRTDDSTRNDESSEHDLLADDITSLGTTDATNTNGSMRLRHSSNITGSPLVHERTTKEKTESERFHECFQFKNISKSYEVLMKELMLVEEEPYKLDLKEQDLEDDRLGDFANGMPVHLRLSEMNENPRCEKSDKESAYNTGGESCRSIANECNLSPFAAGESSVSAPLCSPTPKHFSSGARRKSKDSKNPATKLNTSKKSPDSVQRNTKTNWVSPSGEVEESYLHCVSLQRQTFTDAKVQQAMMDVPAGAPSFTFSPNTTTLISALPLKRKIHNDISKQRPIRDRRLRARAVQISEERSGTTTDDDAISEMKAGRYWSKEERRRQLLRAREQRRRRELMMQSRLDFLREREKEQDSILELSQRRSLKRRNRRILDNWITIQELLAHGTRTPDGQKVFSPLLSVTTV